MADVRALRGVRYSPPLAAAIGRLVAPPYDVAPRDAAASRETPPPAIAPDAGFNIARIENVDLGAEGDPHALAAARYHAWRREGVLARDPMPALYLHHHAFADGETRRLRRGLLARVRLAPWADRVILPHEQTFPGPRAERLARLRAVGANLSPLYLLYHDPAGELRGLLNAAADLPPAAAGADPTGAEHRLAVLPDPALHAAVACFFADRRLYVADGHHRYEAALAHRDERRAAAGVAPEAPWEFVLALLADAADPGVRVLPTHRLVRGLPGFAPKRLRADLSRLFDVDRPTGASAAGDAVVGDPILCEIFVAGDPVSWRVRPKPGAPHAALMPAGHGAAWRGLDVAVVDTVVLAGLLGIGPAEAPVHVAYAHDAAAARAAVAIGEAQLALLLPPPSLATLTAVADDGDRLPPKSTYFDPKAPAGLIINELR